MHPKFVPMSTPKTRAEFELRLNALREKVMQGKLHVAPAAGGIIDALVKVRHLPNGRIDMLSVNEQARLQANTMFAFNAKDFPALVAGPDGED